VVSPILSILTFIEKEHTKILGKTLRDIVSQKIGITRKHTPLLVGFQTPHVMRLIREAFQNLYGEKTPPFFSVAKHYHYSIKTMDEHGTSFSLHDKQQFHIRPCGKAALQNAFIAHLTASKLLQESLENTQSFSSLDHCFLPGIFDIRHAPGLPTMIFDSLHTPCSARHFRQTLETVFPHRNYTFFLSFLKDKPYLSIVKELLRDGDTVIFLPNRSPRSISPHFLYNFFIHHKNFQEVSFFSMETFDVAFKSHIMSLDTTSVACIIGSNYLLQEVYRYFSDYFPFTNTLFSGLIEKAVL
jgi:dihydrofolate synthase/folylpolyglutamate synthase